MATVVRVRPGVYLVEIEGDEVVGARRHEIVYVAGSRDNGWAFWNGRVFRQSEPAREAVRARTAGVVQSLTAPMPATIVRVLATPGQAVKTGDTLVLVEAMKMELAIRAPGDGVVKAIHCREGEIVQPDQTLVEWE